MSTFNGVVKEFPNIRVDFFRHIPGQPNPLAGFLSHVHSDHLAGLESLKAPLYASQIESAAPADQSGSIYCTFATKELLLRLERYPHRINFALGILESRKQHYKHLKRLLKPLPLHTPTRIELSPGRHIQVTLFDANHCSGACMFLIEDERHAILYTGDVRSEPWWVVQLIRNPILLPYTIGNKQLDCIYLDTSFVEDVPFPTKAEGLKELLMKLQRYPPDTTFHFSAWTFGYEEVWVALSRALQSPIHVDDYKFRLYQSLCKESEVPGQPTHLLTAESAVLCGHTVGHSTFKGILTRDQNVRLHSCEKGLECSTLQKNNVVWIKPIITRLSTGEEIGEIGIGGGGNDLVRSAELEIGDLPNVVMLLQKHIKSLSNGDIRDELEHILKAGVRSNLSLDTLHTSFQHDEITLQHLGSILESFITDKKASRDAPSNTNSKTTSRPSRPILTFPYSRHSSYRELCDLVENFRPKDIVPCTVDFDRWHEGVSVRNLFGIYCSEKQFCHDIEMRQQIKALVLDAPEQSQTTCSSFKSVEDIGENPSSPAGIGFQQTSTGPLSEVHNEVDIPEVPFGTEQLSMSIDSMCGLGTCTLPMALARLPSGDFDNDAVSESQLADRMTAYEAAIDDGGWNICLISTTDNHTFDEIRL